MQSLEVIDNPAAAIIALDPIRSCLLGRSRRSPRNAASKLNYHLKALEHQQPIQVAETRKWSGLTGQKFVASAGSYLISPTVLGGLAPDRAKTAGRLSAGYLIALAVRIVREVRQLLGHARQTGKRLPTLSIDTGIAFQSPEDRANFTRDLTQAVVGLAAHYHRPSAAGARPHRFVVIAYPRPHEEQK
ncbi:MAG: ArsR family transcriptional regulator [Acidobacteria bacterium]|nr:ArsR family transcriptional regulator [Acidobacteriota bacterium]